MSRYQTHAHKVVALLWITTGSQPDFIEGVITMLSDSIRNATSNEIKVSALLALSVTAFMEDDLHMDMCMEILEFLQELMEDRELDSDVMEAVLNAYALLFSSTSARPDRDDFNMILDRLMELLDANELEGILQLTKSVLQLVRRLRTCLMTVLFMSKR